MKKFIYIPFIFTATSVFAQTNAVPLHNVGTDATWLFRDIFPNLSAGDYACVGLVVHFVAKYLRNTILKDKTSTNSNILQKIIAHVAANPLPQVSVGQPVK